MNAMRHLLAAFMLTLAGAAPALAEDMPSFDGQWAGIIHFDKEALLTDTSTPAEGTPMGIEIRGPVVRVFIHDGAGDTEVKPGAFHIAPVNANAIIFASDGARGSWTESWAFVVTFKDDKTLRVEFSRLVNNPGPPQDDAPGTFATRGEGEFHRTN